MSFRGVLGLLPRRVDEVRVRANYSIGIRIGCPSKIAV